MKIKYFEAIIQLIGFSILIIAPTIYFLKKSRLLNEEINFYVLAFQLFDGIASFVSINYYNYIEQHVLGNFFINLLGPIGMVVMKLLFVIPILIILEKEKNDAAFFVKTIIGVLGIAPAVRDSVRLIMGV